MAFSRGQKTTRESVDRADGSGHNVYMKRDNRQRLRTPQGTESFFLEEAYRHRQLLRLVEDEFTSGDIYQFSRRFSIFLKLTALC